MEGIETGTVELSLAGPDSTHDKIKITVYGVTIDSNTSAVILPGGTNTVNYIIGPSGFVADRVDLIVRNKDNTEVYRKDISAGNSGTCSTTWDGKDKWNNPLTSDGNPYKLIVEAAKEGRCTWGVKTNVKVPTADIDTDSDNDGTINENEAEENVEAVYPEPGKIIGCGDEATSLAEVKLKHDPASGAESCQVKLIPSSGSIKVWQDSSRSQQITSENVWTMSSHPASVYVEGVSAGQADLTMQILGPTPSSYIISSDTVRFTVGVDADVDSSNTRNFAGPSRTGCCC